MLELVVAVLLLILPIVIFRGNRFKKLEPRHKLIVGASVAIIGAILAILGIASVMSVRSQIEAATGKTDIFGIGAIAIGALLAIAGIAVLISSRAQHEANSTKKCPHCAEQIKAEAKLCRYCGRTIDSEATQASIEQSNSQM